MGKEKPIVSIIIPVYKVEKFLRRCVDSVLGQSYQDLEIILVDDGSPDRSPVICDEYARKNKNIVVLHKKNGGLSSARNAGLDVARGDYVYFLDSDDFIPSDCISKLVEVACKEKADIVFGNVVCKSNKSGKEWRFCVAHPGKKEKWNEDDFWRNAFAGNTNCIIACNKLYRTKLFKELRFEEGKLNEDELILHRLIRQCKIIVSLPEKLYYYCQNNESITHSQARYLSEPLIDGLLEREEYFEENKKCDFACQQMLVIIGNVNFEKIKKSLQLQIKEKLTRLKDDPKSDEGFKKKAELFLRAPGLYVGIKRIREKIKYGRGILR